MSQELKNNKLRFLIGNIRDKERLAMAMEEVNFVFHCAAMKRIEACEVNPFEAVKTNVLGTQNALDCALKQSTVEKFVSIGTDKCVESNTVYGSTKHLLEKLTISAMFYRGRKPTKFFVTRYGNVLNSRGSLLPIFLNQLKKDKTHITDFKMTRFTITMNEAVDFILNSMNLTCGGEVFIPKLRAYRVIDFARAIQS
jgi:UDP-N-acetylglucosamine 4,6-dehydratase/UDP-glucose 4-epimerase